MSHGSFNVTAREQLILAHLPQVWLIASQMHRLLPRHLELDDLVSVGCVGLIEAVDRYDPQRGCLLKTLAERRIRGAILDYLRKVDPLTRRLRRFVKQRDKAAVWLELELGRAPESAELAHVLGLSIERYRKLDLDSRAERVLSLDAIRSRACA